MASVLAMRARARNEKITATPILEQAITISDRLTTKCTFIPPAFYRYKSCFSTIPVKLTVIYPVLIIDNKEYTFVSEKLIQFVNTGTTTLSVNFPEIQLSEVKDAHRLIHIHHDTPGVLAQVNNIFAESKINILGQYLKTNEYIGYVITDVNKVYSKDVITKLKKMKETIRVRVLY